MSNLIPRRYSRAGIAVKELTDFGQLSGLFELSQA